MAPVARGLADAYRVLEPFQRRSGGTRLTVAAHVRDLRSLLDERCPGRPPALLGSSWGAMLALAFAAEHPTRCGPIALIGCGTFDLRARARMNRTVAERMDDALRGQLERLHLEDPDEQLRRTAELLEPLYCVDPIEGGLGPVECDARAFHETWDDMQRQQREGLYPAAFRAIEGPVLMLHGAQDPHPGPMIRESLLPYLPQLEYVEWDRCGHYPWIEREVREVFFSELRRWLGEAQWNQGPSPGS